MPASVFLLCKNVHMGLTKTVQSAILWLSIKKCVDRGAIDISTPAMRNGYSGRWKGEIAEADSATRAVVCWAVREYLPDCHYFVERYRGFQIVPVGMFVCISMGRFTSGPFFILPEGDSGIQLVR